MTHEVTHLKPVLAHAAPGDVDIEELLLHSLVGTPGAHLLPPCFNMFNKRREVECHLGTTVTGKARRQVPELASARELRPSGDVSGLDLCELSHQAALLFGSFGILFSSRDEPFSTGSTFLSFLS